MVTDLWLRRRLGSAGRGRLRVLEVLRERLGAEGQPALSIGLADHELDRLCADCRTAALALAVPARGDAASLRRILWWGSALGDIASAVRPDDRDRIVREAALFNLGVALFDSVVDRAPQLVPPLARALAPARLEARLHASGADPVLAVDQPLLEPLVGIFDAALGSIGQRFRDEPAHLEHLRWLLERMFLSELGLSPNPFAAKTLPVTFIGALAGPSRDWTRVFDGLSRFMSVWDDWLDLAEDMRRLAPNAFLGGRRGVSLGGALYAGRSLARVAAGGRLHGGLGDRLFEPLDASLIAARAGNEALYTRTIALYSHLLS